MKSLIERLPAFAVYGCGICCDEAVQCESCLEKTISSAGLDKKYIERIRGKLRRNRSYIDDIEYGEVAIEMRKIIKEVTSELNPPTGEEE